MPNPLIGKIITAIYLTEDKQAIKFEVEDVNPTLIVLVEGDCCSISWVENFENPEAAIGSPVLEAVDIAMPDLGEQPGHDVMEYYGFKIVTAKGHCIIDYRNDSNGDYGGNLCWQGVFGPYWSAQKWVKVAG